MRFRSLSALATVLVTACTDPTRVCDLCTTSALVYGIVATSASQPVGGVAMRAYVGADPCVVRAAREEVARAVTDGAGRYRMQLTSPLATPHCLQVESSVTGGETARTEASVRFKPSGSLPYDSIRVDVRVP